MTTSTWSGTVRGTINRTFDNNFRVISDSVNGSQSVTYGYDNDGLLTQAGSLAIGRNLQNGLITGTTLGSLTDSYSYTVFGEVIGYQASFGTTAYKNLQYTRDNLGRITQKVEDGNTYAYSYDLAGRLTDVSLNSVNQAHYTYDGNSNRLSVTTPGGTVSGTYDAQDRLTQYGENTYTYSNNGELLSKTNTSGTTNYTYDALENLMHVSLSNGTQVDYVIDGQNRRIGKKINGSLLEGYLYSNQLRIVAETDMNNAIVSRFIYGSKANIPDYMIKGGNTYRIISDHLGSPRLVVNLADGSIAEAMNFDEFGNVTSDTNTGFIPFGFAGGLYDPFTGLTRFGARDYDSETGRWTSKDPIRFTGRDTNLFGYSFSDPINFTDRSGKNLAVIGAVVIVGAIVVGTIDRINFAIDVGKKGNDIYNIINSDPIKPPEGKSPLATNPDTGNPYAYDQYNKNRNDFLDTLGDIGNIGKDVQEQITPGSTDIAKWVGKACRLRGR